MHLLRGVGEGLPHTHSGTNSQAARLNAQPCAIPLRPAAAAFHTQDTRPHAKAQHSTEHLSAVPNSTEPQLRLHFMNRHSPATYRARECAVSQAATASSGGPAAAATAPSCPCTPSFVSSRQVRATICTQQQQQQQTGTWLLSVNLHHPTAVKLQPPKRASRQL